MLVLKCALCGWEQIIKKRIDKELYYELTHAEQLWCPCNKCKEAYSRIVPDGYFRHSWVLGDWEAVLSKEVAERTQKTNNYGWWSGMVNPSPEYLASVQRANRIKELGLQMLQEQDNTPN